MTTTVGQPLPLVPGEAVVPAGDELLFRQITEHKWDSMVEVPSSTAFAPTSADHGKPSFSRSSLVTAQESRDWHRENARSPSLGVWACSTAEVAQGGTRSVDDSGVPLAPGEVRAPGHAYVDYRHLSKGQQRVLRALLLAYALDRQEVPTT